MSDITAYEDTEFYFTGTRFDVVIVGTVAGSRKIISMNTALDSTVRDYMDEQGISIYMYPNPLTNNFCIPKTITVMLAKDNIVTVDFREYCRKVACEEVGYDSRPAEYHKAGCVALKNYACYRIMTKSADVSYHIGAEEETGQIYKPNTDCSQWPNLLARLDEVWNIFVVDSIGSMILTEYRSGKKEEHREYDEPSSGVMLHSRAYTQALNEGMSYTKILEYAYNNSKKLEYVTINFKWIYHEFVLQPDGNYKCKKCGEYQGIVLN